LFIFIFILPKNVNNLHNYVFYLCAYMITEDFLVCKMYFHLWYIKKKKCNLDHLVWKITLFLSVWYRHLLVGPTYVLKNKHKMRHSKHHGCVFVNLCIVPSLINHNIINNIVRRYYRFISPLCVWLGLLMAIIIVSLPNNQHSR